MANLFTGGTGDCRYDDLPHPDGCWCTGANRRQDMATTMHYIDVIMTTMASQITSLTVVLLNRLFRRRSKKTAKLRVTGLCVGNSPGPVNSPHKGPVTRKMILFDDAIMLSRQWPRCSQKQTLKNSSCLDANFIAGCHLGQHAVLPVASKLAL